MNKKRKSKIDAKAVSKLLSWVNSRTLVARYDSLRPEQDRPRPQIRTDYTETQQVFSTLGGRTRPLMYAEADQLYDNTDSGSQVDSIIRMTIGEKGGEPIFVGENAEYNQKIFDDFKRHCGWYQNESYNEMLCMILRAVLVHGDCLVVMDDVLTDGKLAVYDADQITSISDFSDWCLGNNMEEGTRQVEGCVLSPCGRVLGWFLTAERNRNYVSSDRVTFISAEIGRLVFQKKKITQYRGESSLIPCYELSGDTNDLLKAEIRSAQLTAEHALIVEQPEGFNAAQLAGVLDGFTAEEQAEITASAGLTAEDVNTIGKTEPDKFDAFAGKAALASVSSGTKITSLNNASRPSAQIMDWSNRLADLTGKRLGIMSCLSRGRAENSYSSGRIEIELSWLAFREYQKLLENQVVEYVVNQICPHADYIIEWTNAIEIDAEKEQKTLDAKLRGGRITYQEMLGPRWMEKLKQLSIEKKYIEGLGLGTMSIFQTSSGTPLVKPGDLPEDGLISEDENETN